MIRKFFITTFGCRTNQADSAAIRQDFVDASFEEVTCHSEADVIVLNSCTVTHRSDQQVRQLTRKMRRENPTAQIIVTGCLAQRDPERLAGIRGLTAVVGNTRKQDLVRIASGNGSPKPAAYGQDLAAIYQDGFEKVRRIDLASATQIGGRTRPFVKIQDGCDARCSYCIIPSVRGPSRSVPPEQVLGQVRELVGAGFREVVLTGIHIGTYGLYLEPRFRLDQLLERIVEVPGLGQLRLSSIEPMELSRRVIELAARSEKIAPHFHICLQSGSDRILRKMLRPYKTDRFLDIVTSLRATIPSAAIGTDLIVGFPGETDADHSTTRDVLEQGPFTYVHVFPYSDRPGTSASGMDSKVPPPVIAQRSAELRRIGEKKQTAFRRQFLGQSLSLLTLTETRKGMREALTGNYLKASVPPEVPGNRLVRGCVSRIERDHLIFENVQPA
jgi:threonylcarbamoyladenosine tRNA methylthiotransferase MtaB